PPHEVAMAVALHWFESGDADLALPAAIRAAETAGSLSATGEAKALWARALSLFDVAARDAWPDGFAPDEAVRRTVEAYVEAGACEEAGELIGRELAADHSGSEVLPLWLRLLRFVCLNELAIVAQPVVTPGELDTVVSGLLELPPSRPVLQSLLWVWW